MAALVTVAGPPAAAAVLGNAFIGKASMRWFRALGRPRFQLPMPAFVAVGLVCYVQLAVVVYRAWRADNSEIRNRALLVLAGNELWIASFFGLRSTRNGFLGLLIFIVPLLRLQRSVTVDRAARAALTPYTVG
jgi:tryptophan-rich sensory protein